LLLETQDIRRNDILIYSQNQFDFESNFKIIFKNESIKKARPVSYFDVCELIKDPVPKSIILYRLLTNVSYMDAYSTKYGYFIRVNDKMELVYFDPIFALKDLRHLKFQLNPESFRFKIQQVGLQTSLIKDKEINFSEVYSFDMKAEEAKYQNDKIFADAIFAFDKNYSSEEDEEDEFDVRIKEIMKNKNPELRKTSIDFEADNQLNETNIAKPNLNNSEDPVVIREEKIHMLKNAMGINSEPSKKKDFTSFLNEHAPKTENTNESNNSELLDMFKSPSKGKTIDFERESVIFKLKNS